MTRLRRVSPSQTTKDSIIVPHNTKGQPVDPNTWEPLVKGQIDVGHNYQFEERVMRKAAERVNMSQADYSKMMNDPKLYRLETRRNNRSHKFECPNYSEQVHAAFKTIRQFYNKQRSAQREAVVEARLKAKYGNKPHYKSTVQHTDGKHAIIGYSTRHPAHRSAQGSRSLSDIAASHKSAAAPTAKARAVLFFSVPLPHPIRRVAAVTPSAAASPAATAAVLDIAASLAVTDANHIFKELLWKIYVYSPAALPC